MALTHFTKSAKPRRSTVYDSYWSFASKRFDIFLKRLTDPWGPWTSDSVIANNRFTNIFRASDRVSQYLISLQYEPEALTVENIFFRTILFKFFNKIETYENLKNKVGIITAEDYSLKKFDEILSYELAKG
ncbi:MAG: hypothetical protein EOP48_19120, partial [Sphingobacteriales bacterium]